MLEKFKKAQQQLHVSQSSEYDWNLLQTCISLLQNIGDFCVKLNECREKVSKAVLEKKKKFDENNRPNVSFLCSNYQIVGKRESKDFQKLFENAQIPITSYDQSNGIFYAVFNQIKPICEYIHDTTLATIFTPIENQLKTNEFAGYESNDLSGSDLPDYSFAPQEFITVIGQVRDLMQKKLFNQNV